ncbi:YqjF family protein [Brevibacillus sp. SAFN-007a]|uniref:YqjF family protein n=1 Tax=Brevibacillus sp. SAFN-007a TaxID=3436862 RepID=UPI003F7F89FB
MNQGIIPIREKRQQKGWKMTQTWEHLLFAHWAVSPEAVRGLIPAGLELDTYEGRAWISVIPFLLTGVRLRRLFPVPYVTTFPEINVRTYVRAGSQPGVYFLSLDTSHLLVTKIAESWYRLPYYHTRMDFRANADRIDFQSERRSAGAEAAAFRGSYRPVSEPALARQGTLEHWLTERYTFFCQCKQTSGLYSANVYHEPWMLQRAEADIRENSMLTPLSLSISEKPDLLVYARGVESFIWPLERLLLFEGEKGR